MRVFGWAPDSSSLCGEPAGEGLVVLNLDAETNSTSALERLPA